MCPESSDMANFPCSSTTITAGSLSLLVIKGEIILTAIPHAVRKTSASNILNIEAVNSLNETNETQPSPANLSIE